MRGSTDFYFVCYVNNTCLAYVATAHALGAVQDPDRSGSEHQSPVAFCIMPDMLHAVICTYLIQPGMSWQHKLGTSTQGTSRTLLCSWYECLEVTCIAAGAGGAHRRPAAAASPGTV